MSTKKINAGDTLTVGDLTDDHLGAFIEVGNPKGILYRMTLASIDAGTVFTALVSEDEDERAAFSRLDPVKVIAPPPVVQPDAPTELGQCIRIEGDDDWLAVVAKLGGNFAPILDTNGDWWYWGHVLSRAGNRRIIVSDPPRWLDETPVVPERIEVGEWPDDDTNLREWEWLDHYGDLWRWDGEVEGWRLSDMSGHFKPLAGPWTRGERVE